MRIYVGNLNLQSSIEQLLELFQRYGVVNHVDLILDHPTGLATGHAFVDMPTGGDGAVSGLNGFCLDGRCLLVHRARGFTDLRSLRRAIRRTRKAHEED